MSAVTSRLVLTMWASCSVGMVRPPERAPTTRVNRKQDHKDQGRVERNDVSGLQPIATGKFVVVVPDLYQNGEADAKCNKALHGNYEVLERLGHFKRNHQQGDGESKHSVSESLQPRDFASAPSKMLFRRDQFCPD